MHSPYDLPPRAMSLPNPNPGLYFNSSAHPLLVPVQPIPRKDSRRGSEMITPPISPEPIIPADVEMADVPHNTMSVSLNSLAPRSSRSDDPRRRPSLRPIISRPITDLPIIEEPSSTWKLTDFDIRGTLGTGTFGKVLLVRLANATEDTLDNPRYFALKILRKSEVIRQRQVEHVNAEREILSRVRHPFVVNLYATFQDHINIYMLISYVPGGELFTHLRRAQRFTPDVTRFYLATIVLALKYLHSHNIIYRDLKPENLLLDSRGYLRLTDFGFAKVVEDRTWTLCGTPEYLAPEIILSDGHGKAADWWACGILCYEMLVGHPPFWDETPYGIYEKILRGWIRWPRTMDNLSRELVRAFLHPDRSKRLGNMIGGPQDVLDHPWFRGVDWDALERREIEAPIIPHVSSLDDTRHFSRLPLPSPEDIPGLISRDDAPPLVPLTRDEIIGYP